MIEKIQEIRTKGILTKSNLPIAGYSVNPYVGCPHGCKYCYASFMKRFTNHKEPWGTFLDVKNWESIRNPEKYRGECVIIGSVTDGYHPFEEKYKRTRLFLEQMQGSEANLIITTKSDLVVRDLDLIKSFPNPLVSWSINTLDEEFRADMDSASTIKRRIKAMKTFHDAGIRTTCFISPIFPGITDVKAIINEIRDQCDYIWLENLNLRGDYKATIMNYITDNYSALVPLYKEIYEKKNREYWIELDKQIKQYANENGYMYLIDEEPFQKNPTGKPIIINYFYHEEIRQSAKK
ncbi:radical SAM mobile pair protein B [Clostridium sp. SHJSY1]|uniref:radical SAM mobile pair protein B n=1 Tax=Clostridium sp. SHJSY1 TaxID=2942483 RepID=UPI0028756769|nr:radical SAM mobile pair protein B [Clostridium sp. SHJSY1]MDS0526689.1 radical SAM mobile pair protein B [Clostridium sp. SHJSY1]